MTGREITTDHMQALMNILTGGALPDSITIQHQPQLTPDEAFSVIRYLQERMYVLPDHFEMCAWCNQIFDYNCEGHIADADSYDEYPWYNEQGFSRELIETHDGLCSCSEGCEYRYLINAQAANA